MKGVIFNSPRSMELSSIPDPKPGSGEVLIRVESAGVCGTDVHIYDGDFIGTYPVVPGHEFSGEIVELGPEVDGFHIGDRVAVSPNIPCYRCYFCKRGSFHFCRNLRAYGVHLPGGFEEFVSVRAENVFPIGELSFDEGALIEPLSCVIHGVNLAEVRPGDKVLIFGMGPIGLLLSQVIKISGSSEVIGVDLVEAKLELAEKLGVDKTFKGRAGLRGRILKDYPLGFDLVVDATGVPGVVEGLTSYVKDMGRVLYFGVCPKGSRISLDPFEVYKRELKIIGTFSLLAEFGPAIELVRSGRIDLESLISHRLPLEDFGRALDMMRNRETSMKIVIKPHMR